MPNTHVPAIGEALPVAKMNRRAALAGILSAPLVSAAQAETDQHPDAELIELGREFDAAYAVAAKAWWHLEILYREQEARDPRPARVDLSSDPDKWVKRHYAWLGTIDADLKANDATMNAVDDIIEQIRAIPPQTVTGLLVWARCMAFSCMNPGDADASLEEVDWDKEQIRRFVMELERMASEARQ